MTEINGDEVKIIFAGDNGHWTWIPRAELDGRVVYLLIARDARTRPDERIDAYITPDTHGWFRKIAMSDLRPYTYVLLASFVANALSIAGVIFSMQVYDRVIPAASYPTLMVLTCGVALAFVFEFMIRLARSSILDVLGKHAGLALSERVFGRALRIRADARVLGATLKAGESVEHSVGTGRHAYLVAATGAITIDGVAFEARDGAALTGGQTVTITATQDAEIVLVDSE